MTNTRVEGKTVQNEFIAKINEVYQHCVGTETYGSTTEFYDEDGVVLMSATQGESKKVVFNFGDDVDFEFDEAM